MERLAAQTSFVRRSQRSIARRNSHSVFAFSYTEDRESHERPDRLFILDKILMEDKATDEVRVSFISTGADGRPYGDEWLFRSGIKTQECLDEWDMLLKCDARSAACLLTRSTDRQLLQF